MKLFNLLVLVLAAVAMLMGGASAHPKGAGGGLRKGFKAIKAGIGAIGAIGTGHEIYQQVKNRG
uniref:SFRICE_002683 n=1 Tax=Spodoptera frugiperda TaxID=7108 RepID=A0A2H1VF71_SPOFR